VDLSKIKFEPSPSFGVRGPNKVSMIIIHACAGTMLGTVATFKNSLRKVSAHYIVDLDGSILQMVKLENAAWHAMHYPNLVSIGIEHVDRRISAGTLTRGCMQDRQWYTKPQLDASAALVAQLMHDYNVPLEKVIGHNDPSLRPYGNNHQDPGPYWPWIVYRQLIQQQLQLLTAPVPPSVITPKSVESNESDEDRMATPEEKAHILSNSSKNLPNHTYTKEELDKAFMSTIDGRSFKKRRLIKRKP
jgi:N-acetyl-anhydromuramyl-L-alanine amidase AmpD